MYSITIFAFIALIIIIPFILWKLQKMKKYKTEWEKYEEDWDPEDPEHGSSDVANDPNSGHIAITVKPVKPKHISNDSLSRFSPELYPSDKRGATKYLRKGFVRLRRRMFSKEDFGIFVKNVECIFFEWPCLDRQWRNILFIGYFVPGRAC